MPRRFQTPVPDHLREPHEVNVPGLWNVYILGIGIGTFVGMCLFVFGGRLLVDTLNSKQNVISWIIGGVFAITAIVQAWRMLKKKDVQHQIEHPEPLNETQEKILEEINTEKEPANPQ